MGVGGFSLAGSMIPRKYTVSTVSAKSAVAQKTSVTARFLIAEQHTPTNSSKALQVVKSARSGSGFATRPPFQLDRTLCRLFGMIRALHTVASHKTYVVQADSRNGNRPRLGCEIGRAHV